MRNLLLALVFLIQLLSLSVFATPPVANFSVSIPSTGKTVIQMDVKTLLNARPVITYTNGKIVTFNAGIDDGNYSVEATTSAAQALKNGNVVALPDDGTFQANTRHPLVVLNFSNADATSPQVRRSTSNTQDDFTFNAPAAKYSKLQLFCMSSGTSNLTVTLNYSDGSNNVRAVPVIDWWDIPAPAETANRFNLASNLAKWGAGNALLEQASHYIYGFDLFPDSTKSLTSVRIQKDYGGCFTFWGATGVANFALPATVQFDASTSIANGNNSLTYSWKFGDSTSGTGIKPQHVYTNNGIYTVSLIVKNTPGDSSVITKNITIGTVTGPKANAGPDRVVFDTDYQGFQSISLNGTASTDDVGTIVSYVWSENGKQIASGVNPIVDLTLGIHLITLVITDSKNLTSSVLLKVKVSLPNLALKRPVTVSSTETNYGNIAANAVDGDTNTRWSSQYTDPQWIEVDLGQVFNVDSVALHWEAAYAIAYKLEISADGLNWTAFYQTTAGNGGLDNLGKLNGIGRYVRLTGIQRATQYGYSLWEFEVFGKSTIVAGWEEFQNSSSRFVFPNPFTDLLFINCLENVDVEIINSSGSLIYKGQSKQVETGALTSGLYILKVETSTGTKSFKINKL